MKNKVCAIICEYNPMHTGHIHQINEIKKTLGDDIFIVSLMSGNFSQRAKPCILNKYDRTIIALNNNIDMVVGIPTLFSIQSAEIFAYSSIKILNQLKVDYLCFGMEKPSFELLFAVANYLVAEPLPYKQILKTELKKGYDYNTSVKNSLLESYKDIINFNKNNVNLFNKNNCNFNKNNNSIFNEKDIINFSKKDIEDLLTYPNNILALEYAKALIKTNSKIKPIIIKRANNYNDNNIVENFVSSSALREANNILDYKEFLPKNSLEYFKNSKPNINIFNELILANLKLNLNNFKANSQLIKRAKKIILNEYNFNIFNENLKTKCFKQSYLDSFYLNSLFNISEEYIKKIYTIKTNIYAKVLGVKAEKQAIFKYISCKSLIIRKNDALKIKPSSYNNIIQNVENKANILYNLISSKKVLSENDYFNKLLTI